MNLYLFFGDSKVSLPSVTNNRYHAIVIFNIEIKIPNLLEKVGWGYLYDIQYKRKTLVFTFISCSDFEPCPKVIGLLWQPVLLEAP